MSNINTAAINENFPVAGQDNNTQVFRDSFSSIKTALTTAKSEITSLETVSAKLNVANNFFGNVISNANLLTPTTNTFDGGSINTATRINFVSGFYQTFTLTANLTLELGEFPRLEKYSFIRVALKGVNTFVSFSSVSNRNIFYDSAFPAELILDSVTNPYIIEIWYQESSGFHLKFLGKFDTVRYGIGGGPGGGAIPVATQSTTGVVRIGSGLTVAPDGLIRGFSGNYADLSNKPNLEDLSDGSLITIETIIAQLNEFSGDIPNDSLLDSIEAAATPVATSGASSVIAITDTTKINHYRVGQSVKIFGASISINKFSIVGGVTATKNGFLGGAAGTSTVEYKVALFDLVTGSVAPSGFGSSVTLVNIAQFNLANNIALTISRASVGQGVLIYRKIDVSQLSLIAVLGSKDLGTALSLQYADYGGFDRNIWSKKSSINEYTSLTGIIHFPLTAPAVAKYGWYTSVIQNVSTINSTITVANSLFFETALTVVHDDTSKIQSVINSKLANRTRSLRLGNRIYFVSKLVLSDNFSLLGTSAVTTLKKLHWSSTTNDSNRMIQSINSEISNVRLENFSINGNMQNQYLIEDTQNSIVNYTIDLQGSNLVFDNLNLDNIVGGGIASSDPNKLFVTNCTITNSGMSDRYIASPIICDNGSNIMLANNILKNFSDAVDASLTNVGMISNNIVENCGSGILIVGSTKLVSSPNLILGPAGEYIPGPDISNSEFDSVNIIIENNVSFTSDVYVYQENGNLFDLTANRAVLSYRVDKLRKVDNVEELYGEITINGISPLVDFVGLNPTLGQFKFAITTLNVNQLTTTFSYSTLKLADANHIGLIYRALLTEYVPVVTVNGLVTPVYQFIGGEHLYTVALETVTSLNIGARVRFLNHSGTPSLNSLIGEIKSLNVQTKICIIKYSIAISVVGTEGQLTRENVFVIAKGRIK